MVLPEVPPVPSSVEVLLVDNVDARRDVVQQLLTSPAVGATVVGTALDAQSAVEAVGTLAPQVVVVEIQMPVDAGLDAVGRLRRAFPSLPLVVCSFRSDTETKARAIAQGADAYLDKPIGTYQLRQALAEVVATPRDAARDVAPAAPR